MKNKLNMSASFELDDIIHQLCDQLNQDQLLFVIKEINEYVCADSFTKKVKTYFDSEIDVNEYFTNQ